MDTAASDRIVKETTMRAPIERVWGAIADAHAFGEWFGVDFGASQFVPGSPIEAAITVPEEYAGTRFTISVVEMRAPRYFSFRWHPNAAGDSESLESEPSTLIEFVLDPEGEGTRLTIVESGFENIPEERRAEAFRSNEEGWAIQAARVREYVGG